MNPVHEALDAVLPFDFSDPDVRRIALRAIPFTLVAAFLAVHVLIILIRTRRGAKDSFVVSQVVIKTALAVYLSLLAASYWRIGTANEVVYDVTRGWMGLGALIGFPLAVVYLWRAIQDELRYQRLNRRRVDPDRMGTP